MQSTLVSNQFCSVAVVVVVVVAVAVVVTSCSSYVHLEQQHGNLLQGLLVVNYFGQNKFERIAVVVAVVAVAVVDVDVDIVGGYGGTNVWALAQEMSMFQLLNGLL